MAQDMWRHWHSACYMLQAVWQPRRVKWTHFSLSLHKLPFPQWLSLEPYPLFCWCLKRYLAWIQTGKWGWDLVCTALPRSTLILSNLHSAGDLLVMAESFSRPLSAKHNLHKWTGISQTSWFVLHFGHTHEWKTCLTRKKKFSLDPWHLQLNHLEQKG